MDQLFYVDRQLKLLFDDADEHLTVDVTWFVWRSSDGSIGIQGYLIILSVDFGLPFFLVDF